MQEKKIPLALLACTLAGLYYGCATQEITRRSQLANPEETGVITVLTKDTTLYELENYHLTDSLLIGVGSSERAGTHASFSGELKLTDILYIQAHSTSFWKGLVETGVVVSFVGLAASYLGGNQGLSVADSLVYTGGLGSCPFVYSWSGKQYILEAEVFGTSLGKALEVRTCSVLPSLRDDHSRLRVRLTNERPETHYFNSVNLLAAEMDSAATSIADVNNVIWPVYRAMPALAASDRSGRNILEKVRTRDQQYWESDLSQISSDFEDVVELSFSKPSSVQEGSLIVHAINTNLSQVVFKNLFEFLGDQSLAFMHAVEHDPEMIATMRHWIEETHSKHLSGMARAGSESALSIRKRMWLHSPR